MMNKSLIINDLSLGFKNNDGPVILHNRLNTALHSGEVTCLLGANGSGKSTLIRTISGLMPALGGSVVIDGRKLAHLNVRQIARLISIVLTYEGAFGGITAYEMVSMGRSPHTNFLGKLVPTDRQIIQDAMDKTAIQHLAKRKMAELSDGERQKVMIAKSLAQDTKIILLDEPTAFLDFPGKIETLQLLRDMAEKEDKTILLSTHDLHLAIKFADRLWLLGRDKELASGIPEDLILMGKFAEFFNRNNTFFDEHTGEFNFNTKSNGDVGVEGDGLKGQWLRKALERKGFSIDPTLNSGMKVQIMEDHFILTTRIGSIKAQNIEGIIDQLNNI